MSEIIRRRRERFAEQTPEIDRPGEAASVEAAAPSSESTPAPDDGAWKPLDEFALSGAKVVVRADDGRAAVAHHRMSRKYSPQTLKWEPISTWVSEEAESFSCRLAWTPVEYKAFK